MMRASPIELAIARSVIYASLFDYPLTLEQLHQTLVESVQTPSAILDAFASSALLPHVVGCEDGLFFPAGRHDLVAERRRREARSRAFLARHRRLLRLVCAMPYVRMVALSGSIAHLNLERDGDLDLFIVTRGRHVWSVAVAVVVLAKLMRRRRIVCANFVMTDTRLALDQQDLFTASQIIHLKPLVGEGVFHEFLAANPFVTRFYPNFRAVGSTTIAASLTGFTGGALDRVKPVLETMLRLPARLAERACRHAYGWHLRRRSRGWQSPDQVRLEPDSLKLHTRSHRRNVLDRFDLAVRDALDRAGNMAEPAAAGSAAASRR